ncbi:hypothetical protein ACN95_14545 [Gordonia sihwensis]|uniref:hypothetical protein n=1 Tax=Gordonia sihwensis TaxID=173559 RepID=UPI001C92D088|nr:hypothetical protein [Gordonia sihwensis]MBY4571236.1 hypothetical protein [Gordonia sihwensis]
MTGTDSGRWSHLADTLAPGPIGIGGFWLGYAVASDWPATTTAVVAAAAFTFCQFGYWLNQRRIDTARSVAIHHFYVHPRTEEDHA